MQMEAHAQERKTNAQKKGFLSKLKGNDAQIKEQPKVADAGQLAEKVKVLEEQLATSDTKNQQLQAENDELNKKMEELAVQM